MSRTYWRVSPAFWTDEKVTGACGKPWGDDTRLLALYLLTCKHRSLEGLFLLPRGYISEDLGWSLQRLAKPFAELLRDGFIEYDEKTKVCLLVNALDYQQPENPNQCKAAIKLLDVLPDSALFARLFQQAERFAKPFAELLRERFPERYGKPPAPAPAPAPAQENILSDEMSDPGPQSPSRASIVRGRYEHWRSVFPGKTARLTLTTDRQRAISARLAEGIAPETIDLAVSNARGDPWWNGSKDGEWKADIKTICGKGSTVENLAARVRVPETPRARSTITTEVLPEPTAEDRAASLAIIAEARRKMRSATSPKEVVV